VLQKRGIIPPDQRRQKTIQPFHPTTISRKSGSIRRSFYQQSSSRFGQRAQQQMMTQRRIALPKIRKTSP